MPATVFVSFRSSSRHKVALSLNFRPIEVKLIPNNHESKIARECFQYLYALYAASEAGGARILYTRRTGGQAEPCLHDALNWSATIIAGQKTGKGIQIGRRATLERGMASRNLQDHRSFTFSVVYTCLAAEMGMGHLGCLEAHQTEVLSDTRWVGSTLITMQKY